MSTPTQRRAPVALLAVALVAVLPGCAGDGIDAVPAAAVASAEPTAAPSEDAAEPTAAPTRNAPKWGLGLRRAADWSGTASYELRARGGATADVTVTRDGQRLRVDVTTAGLTSSALTAEAGWVACAEDVKDSGATCVTVAAPGADLPPAWDPGVGRLVSEVVPGLDRREAGLYADGYLVETAGLPAAACVEVVAPDTGRYCVTEDGLLRRAKFAGGTLTLTAVTGDVDTSRFSPPARPTPLG